MDGDLVKWAVGIGGIIRGQFAVEYFVEAFNDCGRA